jgi:ADP-ribosylglycohydrolase
VGDAAALGSHWIYDLDELARRFPGGPVGFEQPRPGHYHARRQSGDQTHYGDGALVLLDVVSQHGAFDPRIFGAAFVQAFDEERYDGYLDKATRGTIANFREFEKGHPLVDFDFQRGADDDQPATLTRLSVFVGRYAKIPLGDFIELVDALTLVTQDNPTSRANARFAALLLRFLIDGRSLEAALDAAIRHVADIDSDDGRAVYEEVSRARQAVGVDTTEATLSFGQSCPLGHSVPAALQVLLSFPDNFEQAIVRTLQAGGDNAARASMIGSWLGAHRGVDGVPVAWRSRLSNAERISSGIEKILAEGGFA